MSSAWLRTPRLNEPDDFHEHEARADRYDARRALVDRFSEFSPPRPTFKQACNGCGGAGTAGQFPCSTCRGRGHRNVFVERTPDDAAITLSAAKPRSRRRQAGKPNLRAPSQPCGAGFQPAIETVWPLGNLPHVGGNS